MILARLTAWAVRRPRPVVAATVFLCVLGTVGALRLNTDAGAGELLDSGSDSFAATEAFKRQFGDDPVAVLVRGDVRKLLEGRNLHHLLALETCLSGQVQQGAQPATPTCGRIADLDPSQVTFGPTTFLNQAAVQAQTLLGSQAQSALAQAQEAGARASHAAARRGDPPEVQQQEGQAAAQRAFGRFQSGVVQLAQRAGLEGLPRIDDPQFVRRVVCEEDRAGCMPKQRFSYLFPSAHSALITIRLRPELSDSDRERAIRLIQRAVHEPRFALDGGSYVVSGAPVVVAGLAEELRGEIFLLVAVAVAVMALTLLIVFSPPLRLLPLAVALVAVAIAFGGLALAGGSLTLASVAVLPVLIGLSVDYAIQFQARFREAEAEGYTPAVAARRAAAIGGPVIATAGTATAAGFLVLLLSPVPMVREFGLLLVVGIAIAFAVALTAGFAALILARSPATAANAGRGRRPSRWRGGAAGAAATRALALGIAAPGRVLAVAVLLAVGGWAASSRTEVVSDITELVPADLPALRNLDALQEETGVSGELNVVVRADDVTDPEVIRWMARLKQRVLERHGYRGPNPRCEDAELCPAVALSDLFEGSGRLTRGQIATVLAAVPPYFSQAVIGSSDGNAPPDTAHIGFGIPVMPLDRQKRLIDDIRTQIGPDGVGGGPPPGVRAEVAGLPVLAAEANDALAGSRYWLPAVALAVVGLVLLCVYRSVGRALVPLIPIALATGWSALVVWAIGIPLNPMSTTLGALVIAIATEFSVLLSARFREERAAGLSVGEALRRTYARTGAAVAASGATAIAGFAVLIASEIAMLRDFGIVTVVDLAVALVGVMVVLPAALVWAESGFQPVGGWVAAARARPARAARR